MMKWREMVETIMPDEKAYTLPTRTSNIHIESTHNLHRLKYHSHLNPEHMLSWLQQWLQSVRAH